MAGGRLSSERASAHCGHYIVMVDGADGGVREGGGGQTGAAIYGSPGNSRTYLPTYLLEYHPFGPRSAIVAMLTAQRLMGCCTRSCHRVGRREGHCDANLRVDAGDESWVGCHDDLLGQKHVHS